MHFLGGGYSDIKETSGSWRKSFDDLESSDKWANGYREIGPDGVAFHPGDEQLRNKWESLIGLCSFIFKPKTPLTHKWYDAMIALMDKHLEQLQKNPAKHPQNSQETGSGYPIEWNEFNRIFHKLMAEHTDKILQTVPIVLTSNYRGGRYRRKRSTRRKLRGGNLDKILFSVVIPCHPPDFEFLGKVLKNIDNFAVSDRYGIKEIIIAASEAGSLNRNLPSSYPIIFETISTPCKAACNRNRGWNKATGNWILFLDADDVYHPDKVKVTYEIIQKNPHIDCMIHSFINKINDDFLKPISNYTVFSTEEIFAATFPDNVWHDCITENGGCNVILPNKNPLELSHGVACIKTSSTIRYDTTKNYGEDGFLCRQHLFNKKFVATDAILMVYNK